MLPEGNAINAIASITPPATMTGGSYMRKRREAAGLTIAEVALATVGNGAHVRPLFETRVAEVEADRDAFAPATLAMLRTAFPFSQAIYGALVEGLPHGQLCATCACSWDDPCVTVAGACAWAENDLCTRCAAAPAPIQFTSEPRLQLLASDPFAVSITTMLGALHLGAWSTAERHLQELIERERNVFRSTADSENHADTIMRAADAMAAWRSANPGVLPQGENVHV